MKEVRIPASTSPLVRPKTSASSVTGPLIRGSAPGIVNSTVAPKWLVRALKSVDIATITSVNLIGETIASEFPSEGSSKARKRMFKSTSSRIR